MTTGTSGTRLKKPEEPDGLLTIPLKSLPPQSRVGRGIIGGLLDTVSDLLFLSSDPEYLYVGVWLTELVSLRILSGV